MDEIDIAGDVLDALGLARHHDDTKNWDMARFVTRLNNFDKKEDRIPMQDAVWQRTLP